MLSFFRRSALMVKIFFVVLLVLMSVSMVITLIPGLGGLPTDPNANAVVAEVGDQKITTYDVQQGVQQMGRTNQVPPDMLWLYTEQVLDQMVLEKASVLEAQRLGLRVSPEDMLARLHLIPELFPQGKFVGQQEYEDMVMNRFGTSVAAFESRFRNGLLVEKLRHVVTDPITVSPQEVHEAFVQQNEKVVLHYVFFEPSAYEKQVSVTDAALQEYYKANSSRYQLPEQRRAKILFLDKSKARESLSITEAEARKYYQDHLDDYRTPERVSVKHILLRASEKDPEKLEAARKKAADLEKQLKAGASFEALAKANSDDAASAAEGGDLGWIVRGQTVPNFEKAAFSLAPGTISEPIQTEYGIHILKVIAHEKARVKPFEEVQKAIKDQLLDEKVADTLAASADQAASDWRSDPTKLDAVAQKYHGSVSTPPPFSRGEGVEGIPDSQPVSEDTFLLDVGQIGRPVPLPSGFAIPQLEQIIPPRTPELAEVKDKVRSDYISEKSKELAQAKAMDLVQSLERQQDRNLTKQARAMGLKPATTEPLTRSDTIPSVGALKGLEPKLDSMKPGEVAGPVPMSGGQIVYQLESRQPPDESLFATQKDPIRQQLLSQKQNVAFALFQESLKKRMTEAGDVHIDSAVLQRLTSAAAQ